jgi:hydrogenase nickel incorporation protein HypA/HybF
MSLLEQVEAIAGERGAGKVTRIELKIGPLSGVEVDLLRNAYPLAAAATIAEDADLVIDVAEVTVRCNECGAESSAKPNRLLCASCGTFRTSVVSGDELILQSVELDELPPAG